MAPKSSDRRVFLSSTAKDLAGYRLAVHGAVGQLEGYRCVRMEDFTSQAAPAATYIEEEVPKCHLFVGIVGVCYGSRPRKSSKSYTELEYEAARRANIPCLMFLTPDDFLVPAKVLHDDAGWDEQQSFRQRISQDVIHADFKTPDELALKVAAAIRNCEQRKLIKPSAREKCDCIILCGGYSERLWPLTLNLSKHLLPVGGTPVLSHVLQCVQESSLVKNVYLLTNPKFAPQIKDFLKVHRAAHKSTNISPLVEPAATPRGKLGPVGALGYAVDVLKPRDLLILAGDNLFGFKLDDFLQSARRSGRSANAIYKFPFSEDVSEYGVVNLSAENTVSDFQEKQAISTYRNISTACYFLQANDVELIPKYIRGGGNADSLGSFIHWLISQGCPLQGYVFSSFWFDVGTREKLLEANWKFLNDVNRGYLGKKTSIKGPAQIEPSSTIEDSKIGPYVYVGTDVEIVNSDVHNSIIMDGSSIRHSSIINSIVGPRSSIEGSLFESVCGPGSSIITDPRRGRA